MSQRDRLAELEKQKKELEYVNKKIKTVQRKRKEIEDKFSTIEKLKEGRTLTVKVLDEIISSLPIDRIWLTRLSFKSNDLSLSGIAMDNHTVALFMRRLETSSLMTSVNLVNTKRKKISGHDLMEFALKIKVNAAEKKRGKKV